MVNWFYDTTLGSFSGYQGGAWSSLGGITLGTFDGQSATANGLAFTSGTLYAQSADATHPGMVNTTTQTFGGTKTFSNVNSSGVYQIGGSSVFSIPTTGNTYLGLSDGTSGTGNYNTGVGYNSLSDPSFTGGLNTAIGAQSLQHATTASQNVSIGVNTCTFNTGTSNTCIGYGSNVADGLIGAMSIGSNAVANASGAIILGDSNTKTGLANVNSGVPTARLHLPAGTATAGSAPLKITSGTNLTSAEAGAIENNGTNLFYTQDSGPTRKTLAFTSDIPAAGITALTGDVTASGSGSVAATLATVNSNVGSFGSSTAIPSFTVNGKGLLTAASTNAVVAPAGTLTGTTLASNVVTSSLTTVGTIGAGVWNGTAIATSFGGTGQTTANASLNALLPTQTSNALKYLQTDGTNTSWAAAAGSSGVNFVGLSTAWAVTGQTDRDAEVSVGNWVAFADPASSTPTDLTGGSPTVTINRTTTASHLLNGVGTFEIVKDAANRQGEGASVIGNVPVVSQGKTATITIPWKVLSGSIVQGDLKVYIYDVTNSTLITPWNNDIVGNLGTISATFPMTAPATTPANIQIRLGFYFASTSTTAVTIDFDDVSVGSIPLQTGLAGTDWGSNYTPTPVNFGVVTSASYKDRRVADSFSETGTFTLGTCGASQVSLTLPTGIAVDSAKISSSAAGTEVGRWYRISAGASVDFGAGDGEGPIFYDGSTTGSLYFAKASASGVMTKVNCNAIMASSDLASFVIDQLPVAGWSSNVTMASSSSFKISSYLGNGSRVTGSAPTLLGQYRSYLRNSSANTFTETNGSPGTAPTASDGILLYAGTGWGSGNASNQPTKYDVFVGKNKNVQFKFFKSAGFSGQVAASPWELNSNTKIGWDTSYDPATGVAVLVQMSNSNETSSPQNGIDTGSGGFIAANIYADIVVSENALAIGVDSGECFVWYTTGNGWGGSSSGETKARNFSTLLDSKGNCITVAARTTTTAMNFTIVRPGKYSWKYVDVNSGGERFCVMRNWQSADRSTTCEDVATQYRIDLGTGGAGGYNSLGGTKYFNAGDVIWAAGQGSSSSTSTDIQFQLNWVGY
jgi:hypothetical protein